MDAKKAYHRALKLIQRAPWVIVSAVDDAGWPDNAMRTNFSCVARFPALCKKANAKKLEGYSPINSYSTRLKHIIQHPKVALSYYDATTGETCHVQGFMRVVKDEKIRCELWQKDWEGHCPDGVNGDEYTLIRFEGVNIKYYDGKADCYWGPIDSEPKQKPSPAKQ